MTKPAMKPDSSRRVYVLVKDPNTGKTKQVTLYGVSQSQAVKFIRDAVADAQSTNEPAEAA